MSFAIWRKSPDADYLAVTCPTKPEAKRYARELLPAGTWEVVTYGS